MKKYLSKHFTHREAMKSSIAMRLGINNTPPDSIIPKLVAVAENILEPPRVYFGRSIVPSSWYRTLELNRELKSKDYSQHVQGEAVDFEIPGIDNLALAYWMKSNVNFDQLVLEFYTEGDPSSGWVHASYVSPEKNRGDVIMITTDGRAVFGLPTLD